MTTSTSWFSSYNNIYLQSFIITPLESNGKYSVTLIENDPTAKLKRVIISDVPEKTIVVNLQQLSHANVGIKLKEILNADIGLFKCCDYLLISLIEDNIHFTYIEIKSKNFERDDIVKKFKGASCFMAYCDAIIEHFCELSLRKSVVPKTSYAIISQRNMPKYPTIKKNRYRKSLRPEQFLSRSAGNSKSTTIPYEWFLTCEPR